MTTFPDPLLARLQRAVAPDYRVERRLGDGGMGHVYLAHDVRLNLDVAIKVLRPELDTEAGGEGFLREARTLASIRHANVVVIHRVAEGEGLKFYFMELVNGPTLEQRLASGPMSPPDVARLGINLLDALGAVHRLGFVHRDIKPSNIFVLSDAALLSDFGIARPPSGQYGDPHSGEGTPDYKAPEQVELGTITTRTDIYSTGVVLYEAVAGKRFHAQGDKVDWSGVPFGLARALRGAVKRNPNDRWANVAAFRMALERTLSSNRPAQIAKVGAGILLIAALVLAGRKLIPPPAAPSPGPSVAFDRIEYLGSSDRAWVADSLVRMVHDDLRRHVQFVDPPQPALVVQARVTAADDRVALRLAGELPASEFHVSWVDWATLRDSLEHQILLSAWAAHNPLVSSLPWQALPRTVEGLANFLRAEQLFAEARWQDAHDAYARAERTDSTCWICLWRITEIDRWLGQAPDPTRIQRVLAHAASLPLLYRRIIQAAQLAPPQRIDALRSAAEESPGEFLGWFQLGDELFHRGPLTGHRRAEAIRAFERAVRVRSDFRPAWEHLAWAATAEGDSAEAAAALDSLNARADTLDAYSAGLRALLHVGFAWRFLPESAASSVTQRIVSTPGTQRTPNLAAGPRMLPSFDVPQGAIGLGHIMEETASRDLKRSGLIGQVLGAVAVGRLDDAWIHARRLVDVAPETELALFLAELRGAIALLDSGTLAPADALQELRPWVATHQRAAWMTLLLGGRAVLRSPPGAPRELALIVAADSLARAGRPRAALALLDGINVDSAAQRIDPFFRTVVRLRRAEWFSATNAPGEAREQLLWHEHLALIGLPTELPQAAEVDWAFGTLARWRLARLLDGAGRTAVGEACGAYAAVIRHWTGAPAPFGARADTARLRVRALDCFTR